MIPPGSSKKVLQLQGPRPPPLKVCRDSHDIKKPPLPPPAAARHHIQRREPVVIYDDKPRVIHTTASNFKDIVQRLTGMPNDPVVGAGDLSPAVRVASIENTGTTKNNGRSPHNQDGGNLLMLQQGVEIGQFPGVLSQAPGTLPIIPPHYFSSPPGTLPNKPPHSFSQEPAGSVLNIPPAYFAQAPRTLRNIPLDCFPLSVQESLLKNMPSRSFSPASRTIPNIAPDYSAPPPGTLPLEYFPSVEGTLTNIPDNFQPAPGTLPNIQPEYFSPVPGTMPDIPSDHCSLSPETLPDIPPDFFSSVGDLLTTGDFQSSSPSRLLNSSTVVSPQPPPKPSNSFKD